MATAKVFQSGNSQAVRLPKEFRFASSEVEIFRRGDDVVMRERRRRLSELLADLPPWPDDIDLEGPEDPLPEEREGW
jgi:antitoxin VapB